MFDQNGTPFGYDAFAPRPEKLRYRKGSLFRPGIPASICYGAAAVVQCNARTDRTLSSMFWAYLLAFALIALGALLARVHKRKLQVQRDSELKLDGPTALFLRPFLLDKGLRLINPARNSSGILAGFFGYNTFRALSPSEYVGCVLEPYLNVRQFSGRPEDFANTRILLPEGCDWKPYVKAQIAQAALVVIMPLVLPPHGSGSMWELEYLCDSGRLENTIAIMPHVVWRERGTVKHGWELAQIEASAFGVELPPYDVNGDVFIFKRQGDGWRYSSPFNRPAHRDVQVAVNLVEAAKWLAKHRQFELLDR